MDQDIRVAEGTTNRLGWESRRRLEEIVSPPEPLLKPVPRSAMFFPLVMVVAVLPGLYALNWWDLNAPGPWWGMRGLAVLEGRVLDQSNISGLGSVSEAAAYHEVAMQPPLYAWLEASCLLLSRDRDPLATVLPSYVAGVLVVIMVYLHGRLWCGRGIGLTAAVLTAFSRDLLVHMQQASPVTIGLAAMVASLLCYGQHLVATGEGQRRLWAVLSGLSLGLAGLTVGLYGFVLIPVALLHQVVLAIEPAPRRPGRWWRAVLSGSAVWAGFLAISLALMISVPWFARMFARFGGDFLVAVLAPGQAISGSPSTGLVATLMALAPATLPLTFLGAARGVMHILSAEENDSTTTGLTFWIVWLLVAALVPALWPNGPGALESLFLLIPSSLLAAQAMADLAARRIASRNLIWLAPLTALFVAWWFSADLRGAVASFQAGRRPNGEILLKLHLGLDLLIILAVVTRRLDRWARRQDGRRRMVLAGFLVTVLIVTMGIGFREVCFRHQETADVLDLRDAILPRQKARPFNLVAVVSPSTPAKVTSVRPNGGLRFVLRATLPHLTPLDLARVEDLLTLPKSSSSQRLVILVGARQSPRDRESHEWLRYRDQSQLGLEAFHSSASGGADAYATPLVLPRPHRGRR